MAIETLLLIGSILVLLSITIMVFFQTLGIPALVLFLVVGMFAGSDGLGGLHFNDPELARSIGVVALVVILFSGGLDTNWERSRPALWQAVSLASLGVLLTAVFVGAMAYYVLDLGLMPSFLLGAIISSTDAAAVFSILRIRNTGLPKHLSAAVELESGTNDPMAVFLTVGMLQFIANGEISAAGLSMLFLKQMGLGGLAGFGFGKALVFLMNRIRFPSDGIAFVFTMAFAALAFSLTDRLGGSGFLAIYVAGIIAGNSNIKFKKSMVRFWDGQAWICQIGMFLVLGLLVFPNQILDITKEGLLISAFLMLVARPVAVFLSLPFSRLNLREKGFLSWVGLRGAVPIILATFPFGAGIPQAGAIFNIVFFIVLTSALLQGWSLPLAARVFKVIEPTAPQYKSPIDFTPAEGLHAETLDFILPLRSALAGKSVVDLKLPPDTAIVLLSRRDEYLIPGGGTALEEGDVITLITAPQNIEKVRGIFTAIREEKAPPGEA